MKTLELSLKKPKNGAVTHKENRKPYTVLAKK